MKLNADQIRFFEEQGYLALDGVLEPSDLDPVQAAYEAWIDERARELLADDRIIDLYSDASFDARIGLLAEQCSTILDGMDIMQARLPAMCGLLQCANLLDAVEGLVGSEITCNPIQHIRAKPPDRVNSNGYYVVPWHQDAAVTWAEADDTNIVTCWIAFVDATVENGCMEVLPGVFKLGYLPHHTGGAGTTIRPDVLPEGTPVDVPVKRGGVVFMSRFTPHRSTPNNTDMVRWSIDLRYQPTGLPTGRPFYPEFAVRSSGTPQAINYLSWSQRWQDALAASHGVKAHRV